MGRANRHPGLCFVRLQSIPLPDSFFLKKCEVFVQLCSAVSKQTFILVCSLHTAKQMYHCMLRRPCWRTFAGGAFDQSPDELQTYQKSFLFCHERFKAHVNFDSADLYVPILLTCHESTATMDPPNTARCEKKNWHFTPTVKISFESNHSCF